MRETKVSPYLKNLQRNALFYLQMASLLLLLFSLLAPFIKTEQAVNGQTILIVDTSASMLASKEEESLFEKHKVAMKELATKRAGQPITIVTTGKEPTTFLRDETNLEVVLSAIDKLEITYEHEYMENAIEFTDSLAAEGDAVIHIFTDALDRSRIPEVNETLTWFVSNSEMKYENVSIDKFGALNGPDGIEAIIKLKNDTELTREGTVIINDRITGRPVAEQSFLIEGNEDLLLSFTQLPETTLLHAEMIVEDDYKADNHAYVLLGKETTSAIVDVQLHELIKKAIEAVGLSVSTGSSNELAVASEDTIVVTNDVSFLTKETGPVLLIGRNDHNSEEVTGAIHRVNHPLFSIVDISDVYVSELYPSFEEFETLATVGDKPFIQQSPRGDIAILSDIEMTDWPLHPSFPLFIWSAIEMYGTDGTSLGSFIPNERKAVLFGSGNESIEIYTMNDEYVTTIIEPSSFIAPNRPGIYKAHDGDVERLFAVHLEGVEKKLGEGTSFQVGRTISEAGTESSKRMIGAFFIVPVLFLMLLEWEVQRRRGYPN